MKTSMKILLGFVAILILSITQMGLNYKLQRDILDNTQQIKDVEAPLLLALQQGISYASITTEQIRVAVLYALKGQYTDMEEHKMTYQAVNQELSDLLNRDFKILLNQSQKPQEVKDSILKKIAELERLHLLFVDLERKAFIALDNKDAETAYSLVMGGDYEKYQQELQPIVEAIYIEITQGVTETENSIIERSQQFILFNLIFSLINTVILLIIMLMIRSFFAGREKIIIKKEKK